MNDEQIARARKEGAELLQRSLRRMEESYLPKSNGFLMGQSSPSIADLSASTELHMTAQLVGVDLTPFPKVQAWLLRVEKALPNSWPEAHGTLNKIVARRKEKKSQNKAGGAAGKQAGGATANTTSGHSAAASSSSWSPAASELQASHIFSAIAAELSSPSGVEAIKKLRAVFRFVVTPNAKGSEPVTFILDLKNGAGSVRELIAGETATSDATFLLSDANFVSLATGATRPEVAFLSGKLKLQGNLVKAMAFNSNVFQKAEIKQKIAEAVKNTTQLNGQQQIKAKL